MTVQFPFGMLISYLLGKAQELHNSSPNWMSRDSSLLKTVKLYDQTVGGLAQSGFQGNLLVTGSLFGQVNSWLSTSHRLFVLLRFTCGI